jgi:hypothetical protein
MRTAALALLFFVFVAPATPQSKPRDWKAATVTEITYTDDEEIIPRSHMVKRQGCQGGIGCYDKVVYEPTHVPLTAAVYTFETVNG